MVSVITIPALGDNLIHTYPCGGSDAFAVDVSDAASEGAEGRQWFSRLPWHSLWSVKEVARTSAVG